MIGILLALQVNNWNSERIANAKMTTYLQNIKEDLITDTIAFNNAINTYKKNIDIKKNLLSLSQFENISTDSLSKIIIPHNSTYDLNATTFNKITNLGITEISKNDSLSKKLYNYYTTRLKHFNSIMNWETNNTHDEANYWFHSQDKYELKFHEELPQFQDESTNRQNLIKIISEPKGRNYLLFTHRRKQKVLEVYENMKESAGILIVEIENELTAN